MIRPHCVLLMLKEILSLKTGPRPGYMQCEYCERHFSKTAAERHIEFCKEQKNRLIQPQVDNNALTRLMAR